VEKAEKLRMRTRCQRVQFYRKLIALLMSCCLFKEFNVFQTYAMLYTTKFLLFGKHSLQRRFTATPHTMKTMHLSCN